MIAKTDSLTSQNDWSRVCLSSNRTKRIYDELSKGTSMTHHVLLVDDEPNILYGAMRNLREQPFGILTASDADSAKLILMTKHIDVIVSDENMPGQSGTQLLKWASQQLPEVVRILLTGQDSVAVAAGAINDGGVFRFLSKPCHPFELAIAIRAGLEQCGKRSTEFSSSY